jgi:hypothetical protein
LFSQFKLLNAYFGQDQRGSVLEELCLLGVKRKKSVEDCVYGLQSGLLFIFAISIDEDSDNLGDLLNSQLFMAGHKEDFKFIIVSFVTFLLILLIGILSD